MSQTETPTTLDGGEYECQSCKSRDDYTFGDSIANNIGAPPGFMFKDCGVCGTDDAVFLFVAPPDSFSEWRNLPFRRDG